MTSSSLCYKDGPALPPLNFTTKCTLSGRYVIFYNERLDGVTYPEGYEVFANVYTELCEVTVNGKLRRYSIKRCAIIQIFDVLRSVHLNCRIAISFFSVSVY